MSFVEEKDDRGLLSGDKCSWSSSMQPETVPMLRYLV